MVHLYKQFSNQLSILFFLLMGLTLLCDPTETSCIVKKNQIIYSRNNTVSTLCFWKGFIQSSFELSSVLKRAAGILIKVFVNVSEFVYARKFVDLQFFGINSNWAHDKFIFFEGFLHSKNQIYIFMNNLLTTIFLKATTLLGLGFYKEGLMNIEHPHLFFHFFKFEFWVLYWSILISCNFLAKCFQTLFFIISRYMTYDGFVYFVLIFDLW